MLSVRHLGYLIWLGFSFAALKFLNSGALLLRTGLSIRTYTTGPAQDGHEQDNPSMGQLPHPVPTLKP